MKVSDPCSHQQGYQRIVAIYIKYLMTGVNFSNKDFLRSATVQGYASSINLLFKLRDMKPPINVAGLRHPHQQPCQGRGYHKTAQSIDILRLSIMSDRTGDEDNMGVYHDNMD
jgi:hypothetical protein